MSGIGKGLLLGRDFDFDGEEVVGVWAVMEEELFCRIKGLVELEKSFSFGCYCLKAFCIFLTVLLN